MNESINGVRKSYLPKLGCAMNKGIDSAAKGSDDKAVRQSHSRQGIYGYFRRKRECPTGNLHCGAAMQIPLQTMASSRPKRSVVWFLERLEGSAVGIPVIFYSRWYGFTPDDTLKIIGSKTDLLTVMKEESLTFDGIKSKDFYKNETAFISISFHPVSASCLLLCRLQNSPTNT